MGMVGFRSEFFESDAIALPNTLEDASEFLFDVLCDDFPTVLGHDD